jgi:hypothetical protein
MNLEMGRETNRLLEKHQVNSQTANPPHNSYSSSQSVSLRHKVNRSLRRRHTRGIPLSRNPYNLFQIHL